MYSLGTILTLTAIMYAMVAKVVTPARSSVRNVVPWISFSCRRISVKFIPPAMEMPGSYMARALQAEDAPERRLRDMVVDGLGVLSSGRHGRVGG
jgi:hypothetical protein